MIYVICGAMAVVAVTAAAVQMRRLSRPPVPARGMCDLLRAIDLWAPPDQCGCGISRRPPADPLWVPCPAHQLLAEWERRADRAMRSEGSGR